MKVKLGKNQERGRANFLQIGNVVGGPKVAELPVRTKRTDCKGALQSSRVSLSYSSPTTYGERHARHSRNRVSKYSEQGGSI